MRVWRWLRLYIERRWRIYAWGFWVCFTQTKNCPQCQLAILTNSLSGTLALEYAHRDIFLTNMVLILMQLLPLVVSFTIYRNNRGRSFLGHSLSEERCVAKDKESFVRAVENWIYWIGIVVQFSLLYDIPTIVEQTMVSWPQHRPGESNHCFSADTLARYNVLPSTDWQLWCCWNAITHRERISIKWLKLIRWTSLWRRMV